MIEWLIAHPEVRALIVGLVCLAAGYGCGRVDGIRRARRRGRSVQVYIRPPTVDARGAAAEHVRDVLQRELQKLSDKDLS